MHVRVQTPGTCLRPAESSCLKGSLELYRNHFVLKLNRKTVHGIGLSALNHSLTLRVFSLLCKERTVQNTAFIKQPSHMTADSSPQSHGISHGVQGR